MPYAVSFVGDLYKHANCITSEFTEVSKFTEYMLSKFVLIPSSPDKDKSACADSSKCKDKVDPYMLLLNKCVKKVREVDTDAFKDMDIDKTDKLLAVLKLIPEDELDSFFDYFKKVTI